MFAESVSSARFQSIPRQLGFIFIASMFVNKDSYSLHHICDSDYIHCHKKLINHLDQDARIFTMGNFLVHLNHIQCVYDTFPAASHELSKCDVDRDDKQDWQSAQKLTFQ